MEFACMTADSKVLRVNQRDAMRIIRHLAQIRLVAAAERTLSDLTSNQVNSARQVQA